MFKHIEAVYHDFDLESSEIEDSPEMIETLDIKEQWVEGKRLYVLTTDGRTFYFVKPDICDWNKASGFLVRNREYSESEIPKRVRFL